MRAYRHVLKHAKREAGLEEDRVTEGTEFRDAIAITSAVILLAAVALLIEHLYHLDGDVCFDALTLFGAHPCTVAIRKLISLFV